MRVKKKRLGDGWTSFGKALLDRFTDTCHVARPGFESPKTATTRLP
jgi:hypothetical protein